MSWSCSIRPLKRYNKLMELAAEHDVEVEEPIMLGESLPIRFKNSPMLAHLEKHYSERIPMLLADRAVLDCEDRALRGIAACSGEPEGRG